MTPVEKLVPRWLERAEALLRYGADERTASLWRLAAMELSEASQKWNDEVLDLQRAASESGYSIEHLGRLVRNGDIPNAGRKHAPKIRRADLPRKPTTAVAQAQPQADIADRLFRDIATSKSGD